MNCDNFILHFNVKGKLYFAWLSSLDECWTLFFFEEGDKQSLVQDERILKIFTKKFLKSK